MAQAGRRKSKVIGTELDFKSGVSKKNTKGEGGAKRGAT